MVAAPKQIENQRTSASPVPIAPSVVAGAMAMTSTISDWRYEEKFYACREI